MNYPPEKYWQYLFFYNFLEQLTIAGYKPEQIAKFVWKPYLPEELSILGSSRDLDFSKVEATPEEVKNYIFQIPKPDVLINNDFFAQRKTVILLVPGFTHHTLRNLSLHEQMHDKNSPHEIVRFRLEENGTVQEDIFNKGNGLKLAYLAYPRANAKAEYILPSLFKLIHEAKTIRKWILEEKNTIVFLGYSYGSPLSLELLSRINTGEFADQFILKNTKAFVSLCGDIGGSYLADYVIDPDSKYNVHKALKLAKKYKLFAKVAGLKTKQDMEDILGGACSLGHKERQTAIDSFKENLPSHLKYFSVTAFLPPEDYKNSLLRNFDDWSMYKQSLASKDISIYNDGQVVLKDMLIPDFPKVPKENKINLGSVRTHHWGVSYKTFNVGKNQFPRLPFYYALIKTLFQAGLAVKH